MAKDNIVTKAVDKAENVFNSLKKAYTDRISTASDENGKRMAYSNPDKQIFGSISYNTPYMGSNNIKADLYTKKSNNLPDQIHELVTPIGSFEGGVEDGSLVARYVSPFERTIEKNDFEPNGQYFLENYPSYPTRERAKTDPTKGSYFIEGNKYTYPSGVVDYSADVQSPYLNLPDFNKTFNTPLGVLSLGTQSGNGEDDWATAYADYMPSKQTLDAYNSIKNAIAKRQFLNSKGTQL